MHIPSIHVSNELHDNHMQFFIDAVYSNDSDHTIPRANAYQPLDIIEPYDNRFVTEAAHSNISRLNAEARPSHIFTNAVYSNDSDHTIPRANAYQPIDTIEQDDNRIVTEEVHSNISRLNAEARPSSNKSITSVRNYQAGFLYVCEYLKSGNTEILNNISAPSNNTRYYLLIKRGLDPPIFASNMGILDALIMHRSSIELEIEKTLIKRGYDLGYHIDENNRIRIIWVMNAVKDALTKVNKEHSAAMVYHATYSLLEHFKNQAPSIRKLIRDCQEILKSIIERTPQNLMNCLESDIEFNLRCNLAFNNFETIHAFSPLIRFQSADGNETGPEHAVVDFTVKATHLKKELNTNPDIRNTTLKEGRLHYTENFSTNLLNSYENFVNKQLIPSVACYFTFVYFLSFSRSFFSILIFGLAIQYGESINITNAYDYIRTNIMNPTNIQQELLNQLNAVNNEINQTLNALSQASQQDTQTMFFPIMITVFSSLLVYSIFGFTLSLTYLSAATFLFFHHNLCETTSMLEQKHLSESTLLHMTMLLTQTACLLYFGVWKSFFMLSIAALSAINTKAIGTINLFSIKYNSRKYGFGFDDFSDKLAYRTNDACWNKDAFATRKIMITSSFTAPNAINNNRINN